MSDSVNTIIPDNVCSEKFNSTDADVVFKSSDDVLFKIHRKNLETSTGGFPPLGFETLGEIVPLTEPSSTLDLLFQYIYPIPQPDIRSLPFETIAAVAEAAEKYQVHPAIYVCTMVMEMALPNNVRTIVAHAARHGHKGLLGKAAPYLIGRPLYEIVSELPGHLVVPWIKYHHAWELQLQEARLYPRRDGNDGDHGVTSSYAHNITDYIAKLEDVKVLKDLTAVFGEINSNDEGQLPRYLRAWRTWIESNLEKMESFDTYLP